MATAIQQKESATQPRIAFITGGAGGLGLATAERFASEGIKVAIADLDAQAASRAAASLPGKGHMGLGIDVCSEQSVIEAFEKVESELGPIAILGTFAGVIGNDEHGNQPELADLTLDVWNRTFSVNATGTFLCLREYARHRAK